MIDREILLGTLLGDSSLQTYTRGDTWRLRFIQKDKDYLFHLYEIWKPFVKTEPKLADDGKGNTRWYFNTTVLPELKIFVDEAQIYYPDGRGFKKQVPKLWSAFSTTLTAKALAYWYMDDGSKKSNVQAYYLCTDCFSLEDVKFLGAIFIKNWGIHVGYHKHRENYRIYIPTGYAKNFKALIEEHVVETMQYKL